MFDFLIVVKDNALAITTLGGIFTIIGGFIGAWIKNKREKEKYALEKQKIESDKKSLRQQMITNNIAPMRQAWINNVRDQISALITTSDFTRTYLHDIESSHAMFKDENERLKLTMDYGADAVRILNNIKLLLPINEINYSLLIDDLKKLIDNIISNSLNKIDREKLVDKIINDSRELLKKEWEVTKSLKEIE